MRLPTVTAPFVSASGPQSVPAASSDTWGDGAQEDVERVVRTGLRVLSLGGSLIVAFWGLTRRLDPTWWVALACVAACVLTTLLGRRVPFPLRCAVLLVSQIVPAVTLSVMNGLLPGVLLLEMTMVVVVAALFGRRAAVLALVLTAAHIATIGVLTTIGVLRSDPMDILAPGWRTAVRMAITYVTTTAFVLIMVLEALQRARSRLQRATEALDSLRAEQAARARVQSQLDEALRLEAMAHLAGGITHDFGNALHVVLGWCELLRRRASEPIVLEGIDAIETSAENAVQMVRDLLGFARGDVGHTGTSRVDDELQRMLPSLRRLLPEDMELEVALQAAGASVPVSPSHFARVILNLVKNAREAMTAGGRIRVTTKPITTRAADGTEASFVEIAVTDTGCGMDERTQARIFEPFFSTKGRGTGLGLASVHGIARQAGGFVTVTSTLGRGSTFRVGLPARADEVRATGIARTRPTTSSTILLVEDDPAVRRVMAETLRAAGYAVVQADRGERALDLVARREHVFDLLCTDGVMPGLRTAELIAAFRERCPLAPVLVCSGHTDDDLLLRGARMDAMHYLAKPFSGDVLLQRIEELLAARIAAPVA